MTQILNLIIIKHVARVVLLRGSHNSKNCKIIIAYYNSSKKKKKKYIS